jgi:hypothetical protein
MLPTRPRLGQEEEEERGIGRQEQGRKDSRVVILSLTKRDGESWTTLLLLRTGV